LPVSGVAGLALALLSLGSSAEADGSQASASAAANADPTAVASKAADSSSSPIRGDSASAAKALLAIVDADPLALARVAQRFGDLAIVALLEPATDTMVRLAAVRTSPWLRAPERALARLAEIASGRDSELAPAAARAAQQISQQLDAEVLARRECLASELTAALIALRALGEREHTAPHVRAYAWAAAAQLVAAGVPLPAVK
jgi:hypothetical protein